MDFVVDAFSPFTYNFMLYLGDDQSITVKNQPVICHVGMYMRSNLTNCTYVCQY